MLNRIAALTVFCAMAISPSGPPAYAQDDDEALAKLLKSNIELRGQVDGLTESVDAVRAELQLLRKVVDRTVAPALAAAQAPTPHSEVARILELLDPKPEETLVDYGCGDARFLIAAVETFGCKAIGVEIDPEQAAIARAKVENAGLQDRIQIIEGDATTVDVKADVGVVYLYPDVLSELAPKLTKLNRFASYQHPVAGVTMTKDRDAYLWNVTAPQQTAAGSAKPATVAAASTTKEVPYAIYGGYKYYQQPTPGCTCSMCRDITSQIANRQHVETQTVQAATPVVQPPAVQQTVQTSYVVPQRYVQYSYCSRGCSGGNCRGDD